MIFFCCFLNLNIEDSRLPIAVIAGVNPRFLGAGAGWAEDAEDADSLLVAAAAFRSSDLA